MAQSELNVTSHGDTNSESANDQKFSQTENPAVDQIVSLAEARERYGSINKQTHGVIALARHLLGSIGIEIGSNIVNDATELVRLRALNAANDESIAERKAA